MYVLQSNVKMVSTKEKLHVAQGLAGPTTRGWAGEGAVGLATEEEACLVSPGPVGDSKEGVNDTEEYAFGCTSRCYRDCFLIHKMGPGSRFNEMV